MKRVFLFRDEQIFVCIEKFVNFTFRSVSTIYLFINLSVYVSIYLSFKMCQAFPSNNPLSVIGCKFSNLSNHPMTDEPKCLEIFQYFNTRRRIIYHNILIYYTHFIPKPHYFIFN